MRIVDEEGAVALSMRTLAERLGSGTATLYRHFASRADLIAHVVDRVFGEVALDADELATMSWQETARAVAHAMFETIRRHKNVAPLLLEQLPIGPKAMANRERWLAMLLRNGFPPNVAARAYATLARYVLGFAIQLSPPTTARRHDDAQTSDAFRGADRSLYPVTVRLADSLPVPLDDEFTFGLDLLLSGLGQLRRSGRSRIKS